MEQSSSVCRKLFTHELPVKYRQDEDPVKTCSNTYELTINNKTPGFNLRFLRLV
jgi:hypothetical protein